MTNPPLKSTYNEYFKSGFYQKRYPSANSKVLKFIQRYLKVDSKDNAIHSFLDFGCGNGRYLVPLLQQSNWQAFAFDISDVAIAQLNEHVKMHGVAHRCHCLAAWPSECHYDIALLMYGVLGHIKTKIQRIELLKQIRNGLNGPLILSVPNIKRRFIFKKQADIEYVRNNQGSTLAFNYHLYDIQDLKSELGMAGFEIETILAESILPEKWVTNSKILSTLDKLLCVIIPAKFGYGLLVCASKQNNGN
ncbi:class I SAM-dependent methyltransferase [Marinicellulosiphila megalodicopiae]|uniref:class I SAM-dependent methyltransferase n=1 Tax=Marinicellulosiphila megalodicopiae TaxID=2724896 RepID=UPI003BB0DD2A